MGQLNPGEAAQPPDHLNSPRPRHRYLVSLKVEIASYLLRSGLTQYPLPGAGIGNLGNTLDHPRLAAFELGHERRRLSLQAAAQLLAAQPA
jgi:hypothetical protein